MGRASARLFAQEGATVFVAGRSRERGEALVKGINDAGGKAYFTELDVVDQKQRHAAVAQVRGRCARGRSTPRLCASNAARSRPAARTPARACVTLRCSRAGAATR
jgi:NAD(P)-dependent dehydrogenase (short-subunit alcohol dehydrogenase family)